MPYKSKSLTSQTLKKKSTNKTLMEYISIANSVKKN